MCPQGFSKHEYWCGLPWPPPGDLPNPGIERESLISPALAGRFFTTSTTLAEKPYKSTILQYTFFKQKKILGWEDHPGLSEWVQLQESLKA